MKRSIPVPLMTAWLVLAAACDGAHEAGAGKKVATTGKEATDLAGVPAEVLEVARRAMPGFDVREAEYEVRDGREYYDIGGVLPDGSELELDMTQVDGAWTVVEFQRDIALDAVPDGVRAALGAAQGGWSPSRIIESDQGDGVIVYEFFGRSSEGEELKVEVKWADGQAELLRDEWAH